MKTCKLRIPLRHGDVNLHHIYKLPETSKEISHNGEFILAIGEVTNHSHRLKVKSPDDLIIRQDKNGDYYFELLAEGELTHEEHRTLVVPKGMYKKFQEREIDLFSNCVRRVVD